MKQLIKKITPLLVVAIFAVLAFSLPASAAGVDVLQEACSGGGDSEVCSSSGSLDDLWHNITNALVYVIGAIAVVMIAVGGFRYTTANGDQSQITSAKNTLIYAIAGLLLAVAAGGIVNFVLDML